MQTGIEITFQSERATECFSEALPLLQAHWDEVANYQDIKLDPDFEVYAMLEETGKLKTYTARNAERKLIGYFVAFVSHHPHHRKSLQANLDIIFILPEYRGGTGRKFISWCENQLRDEGVQVVYQHLKIAHDKAALMQKLGYEAIDKVYGKRLDGGIHG